MLREIGYVLRMYGIAAARRMWEQSPLPQPKLDASAPPAPDRRHPPVGRFLAEMTVAEAGASIGATPLFAAYRAWCARHDMAAASQHIFGRALAGHRLTKVTSGTVRYLDLRLRRDDEPADNNIIPLH